MRVQAQNFKTIYLCLIVVNFDSCNFYLQNLKICLELTGTSDISDALLKQFSQKNIIKEEIISHEAIFFA